MLIIELIFGLILVLWGAEILINGSIALGKKYGVSELIIGVIVIGFGTSLSEFLVSLNAVLKDATNLSLGNIIGSNIANIYLVLGAAGIFKTIKTPKIKKFDIFFQLLVTIFFFLLFSYYKIDFLIGILFLSFFIVYIFFAIKNSSKSSDAEEINNDIISKKILRKPIIFGVPIIIFSITITVFGADLTVESAIKISRFLGIPESIIGLTFIAIGTSLPEIAAGITAARKLRVNLIFGNIIGSNLYNLLAIVGFSSLFKQFNYEKNLLRSDVLFLLFSTVLFTILVIFLKKINKVSSIFLILIYLSYFFYVYKIKYLS